MAQTNYPILLSLLTIACVSLYYIVKHIQKKYRFLKSGFRTRATVCEVVRYTEDNWSFKGVGYVPVIKFLSHNNVMVKVKSKFYCDNMSDDSKLSIGYEFDIIYDRKDIHSMVELSSVRGEIITYLGVALFPAIFLVEVIYVSFR
ncbi:hypothetical protein H7F33_16915 [Pedobacter sp. PAMC26386]|nr:hypothetical protein H7F33_16915 [Pedobacter sp. PAMC26386]